ncbi:MAG: translesion error-prone DNA polymerase V autoproteolytic subunit [Pedobacter sp.]|nr:MAG: translesion error-prone DNA polymerase V autoproteolytic subunit [Pedobacter sp.]
MNTIPIEEAILVELFTADTTIVLDLPFAEDGIYAGFPSPAADYLELTLDLNTELIKNASSTFIGRVKGLSMIEDDIDDGDMVIIDKSLEPQDGKTAVCFLNGEFTLKKLKKLKDKLFLMPRNPKFQPIEVHPDDNFTVWGIVTYVIKKK